MFVDPSCDRARISSTRRTLPVHSSVSAKGRNSRAVGAGACHRDGGSLPLKRTADGYLPSKERVLVVLMQVLFFDQKDYCDRVEEAFRAAVLKPTLSTIGVDDDVCGNAVSFFSVAMDSVGYHISNFHCIDKLSADMFHKSQVKQRPGKSVCEVFLMDVVLNCATTKIMFGR